MSWSDAPDILSDISNALSTFDWSRADQLTSALIKRLHGERVSFPEIPATSILEQLRRKRRFHLLTRVSEAFIRTGQNAPCVRRQYAQALIEQGILVAPELVLETITTPSGSPHDELVEAHGLLGRLFKQLYVNEDHSVHARRFFERALSEYLYGYRADPARNVWHGVNVVAMLQRADHDGIPVPDAPSPRELAGEILTTLDEQTPLNAFGLATRLEALVALGRYAEANDAVLAYSQHPGADAFEIGSTLRQFVEVWRLTDSIPPGSTVLPVLRAALLHAEGGAAEVNADGVRRELAVVHGARMALEKVFGDDRMVTLKWYETGLVRSRSVARIDRMNGKGYGTGWLVQSRDFFPEQPPRVLLLTNAHVVSADAAGGGLIPSQVVANFQGLHTTLPFNDRIVWSSPSDELDATFLDFKNGPPDAATLPVYSPPMQFDEGARVYIIGHPGGRDVEFSLHDNKLLGCNNRLLHYRAPTEGGSSGSPVFEADGWQVIGLHHAGGMFDRLDGGQPPYEANEGIAIRIIQEQTKANPAHAQAAALKLEP